MIQAVMLIALGFLAASLIALLLAPSLWSRAYRLSKKRIESGLPMSLTEIEAAQDQLRASYAVRMRRLETSLAAAKQKAAGQLVDNSHLQMQIANLRDQIAELELQLAERANAATVLQVAVTQRVPDLEREIITLRSELKERSLELQGLTTKLARRDESLDVARRTATTAQDEVTKLRQAMEKVGADRGGRLLRRPSQWSLEDYRAEYDRLNLELSKMRQEMSRLQERDAQQASIIKGDLQKLTELILTNTQSKTTAASADTPTVVAPFKRAAPTTTDLRDRPRPWPRRPEAVEEAVKTQSVPAPQAPVQDAAPVLFEEPPRSEPQPLKETASPKAEPAAKSSVISRAIPADTQTSRSLNAGPKSKLLKEIAATTGLIASAETASSLSAAKASQAASVGSASPVGFEDLSTTILPDHYHEDIVQPAIAQSERGVSPQDEAGEPPRTTDSGSEMQKAMSSARDLRAISELFALSAANQGETKSGVSEISPSAAIAEEARNGHVIDAASVPPGQDGSPAAPGIDGEGEASAKASVSLMDRLRTVSNEAAKSEK